MDYDKHILPYLQRLDRLGSGAFGEVFSGQLHGQEVVIKRPKVGRPSSGRVTFALAMELFTLTCLPPHINIVHLLALCYPRDAAPAPALVYAKANSKDLSRVRELGLSGPAIVQVLEGIARALQHVHAHGFVHSDVKPANILLHVEGGSMPRVSGILADFGLSQRLPDGKAVKKESGVVGTEYYQAPETKNAFEVSAAADVYSFGITLANKVFDKKSSCLDSMMSCIYRQQDRPAAIRRLVQDGMAAGQLWEAGSEGVLHTLADLYSDCVQYRADRRPTMSVVVQRLSDIHHVVP